MRGGSDADADLDTKPTADRDEFLLDNSAIGS